jgi:hypothetical protein
LYIGFGGLVAVATLYFLKGVKSMTNISIYLLALILTTATVASSQEHVGTSCADCPSYNAAFSIENQTGVTLRYLVRWGNTNQWKLITLASGHTETHRYPMGENKNTRVPIPYVRFDRIAGDGRSTPQDFRMEVYAVGYAGYGSKTNQTQPKQYFFKYSGDGRLLDLLAR